MCKDYQCKNALLSPNNPSIFYIREFLIRSHSLRKLKINKFTFSISHLSFPEHNLKSLQINQNHVSVWSQSQPGNHFPGVGLAAPMRCFCELTSSMAFMCVHTRVGIWRGSTGPKDWIVKMKVKSLSHVGLCDPMDCNLPRSSFHGIFQARVLEWVAITFPRGCSRPRNGLNNP